MVSKNNLCSYSLYSLYGQLNELCFCTGCYMSGTFEPFEPP